MKRLSCARSFALLLSLAAISVLTGCSGNFSMPETAGSVAAPLDNGTGDIVGGAYGGRQPIQGARIYLYGAPNSGYTVPTSSTTGQSVPSYAGISLLGNNGGCNASQNLHLDQFGVCYYLTGTGTETFTPYNNTSVPPGSFNLTGLYTCNVSSANAAAGTLPGQQVWLYSVSGDPGAGNGAAMNLNSAAGLTAALGTCPASNNFSNLSFIYMNEVSTVAFAYAVAGFAADATHVSAPTSNYTTGLANAFANAAQLYDISGGPDPGNHSGARYKTPNGYGTPPFVLINSVADILAACINSQYSQPTQTNGISTECNNLLFPSNGNQNGVQIASDTASAAVYIARHPYNANIFQFLSTVEPWHPAFNDGSPYRNPNNGVSSSIPQMYPNEITAAILFNGTGYSAPAGIAADSQGNVFVSMEAPTTGTIPTGANTIAKVSPLGAVTNSSPVNIPTSIVLDQYNNLYSVGTGGANGTNGNLIEITNTTAGQGMFGGSATVSGTPNSYVNSGLSQTGSPAPSVASLPLGLAANGSATGTGYVFIADYNNDDLVKVTASTGQVAITYTNSTYTAGKCLTSVAAVAVDTSGALWTVTQPGTVCRTNLTGANPTKYFNAVALPATAGGLALDKLNNAWITTPGVDDLFYVTSAGSASNPVTSGGLDFPTLITVDGNGNPWVLNGFGTPYNTTGNNARPPSVSEFSSIAAGNPTAISPSSSQNDATNKGGYQFRQLSQPAGLAIDISGNVWISNNATASSDPYANSVVEIIGAATPTLSPVLSTPGQPEVQHGTEQQ